MDRTSIGTFGYVWMVLQGLFSLVAPRKAIKLATAGWRVGFENVGELEPRDWYVTMTRALGVGMLAAGLAGLLFEKIGGAGDDASDVSERADDSDTEGNGPIEIDV